MTPCVLERRRLAERANDGEAVCVWDECSRSCNLFYFCNFLFLRRLQGTRLINFSHVGMASAEHHHQCFPPTSNFTWMWLFIYHINIKADFKRVTYHTVLVPDGQNLLVSLRLLFGKVHMNGRQRHRSHSCYPVCVPAHLLHVVFTSGTESSW